MEIERGEPKQKLPKEAKKVFKGIIFDVYQWEQEMYDGSKTIFERLKRPDTVVVFPILPDGKIILIDEEQPGSPSYIGALGGRVEEGEEIENAARREMLEEIGYEAGKMNLWYQFNPVDKIEWTVYIFIVRDIKKVMEPKPDPGEKIKTLSVSFDELLERITDFSDPETSLKFLEAKLDPEKMEKLKESFKP